jgi:hypothetical protein
MTPPAAATREHSRFRVRPRDLATSHFSLERSPARVILPLGYPRAWFDGRADHKITTAGGAVSQWRSNTDDLLTATQAVPADMPTHTLSRYLSCTGNQHLTTNISSTPTLAWTLAAWYRRFPPWPGGWEFIMSGGAASPNAGYYCVWINGIVYECGGSWFWIAGSPWDGNWHFTSLRWEIGTGNCVARYDNIELVTPYVNPVNNGPIRIATFDPLLPGNSLQGDVANAMVWWGDRPLHTAELDLVMEVTRPE